MSVKPAGGALRLEAWRIAGIFAVAFLVVVLARSGRSRETFEFRRSWWFLCCIDEMFFGVAG